MVGIVYTKKVSKLAKSVADKLSIVASPACVRVFNNKEISVSVSKGFNHVIVMASTETNDDWIELFLLLDAIRNANDVTLCLPYMGYSRQDKQIENASFATNLFSKFLESMKLSRCILLDNHSEPLIRIPTQHISTQIIFEKDIAEKYHPEQTVIVSPDFGRARRAYNISKGLKCDFIICNKDKNVFGELKKIRYTGEVTNKICVVIDDIIDSGSTLKHVSEVLLDSGCKAVVAYCTHGFFSNGAIENLEKSSISEIVITNSICRFEKLPQKFRKLSIDSLIVDAIQCIV